MPLNLPDNVHNAKFFRQNLIARFPLLFSRTRLLPAPIPASTPALKKGFLHA
jgi:hypothetical protein